MLLGRSKKIRRKNVLIGTHHALVCADGANLLCENVNALKKDTDILLDA
jgi:hypothetical protein